MPLFFLNYLLFLQKRVLKKVLFGVRARANFGQFFLTRRVRSKDGSGLW